MTYKHNFQATNLYAYICSVNVQSRWCENLPACVFTVPSRGFWNYGTGKWWMKWKVPSKLFMCPSFSRLAISVHPPSSAIFLHQLYIFSTDRPTMNSIMAITLVWL